MCGHCRAGSGGMGGGLVRQGCRRWGRGVHMVGQDGIERITNLKD